MKLLRVGGLKGIFLKIQGHPVALSHVNKVNIADDKAKHVASWCHHPRRVKHTITHDRVITTHNKVKHV